MVFDRIMKELVKRAMRSSRVGSEMRGHGLGRWMGT